jgi:hypothetical protein
MPSICSVPHSLRHSGFAHVLHDLLPGPGHAERVSGGRVRGRSPSTSRDICLGVPDCLHHVGSDPIKFKEFADITNLPEPRQETCKND